MIDMNCTIIFNLTMLSNGRKFCAALCLEMSGVQVNVATLISDKLTSSISVMKGIRSTMFQAVCTETYSFLSGAVYEKLRCL